MVNTFICQMIGCMAVGSCAGCAGLVEDGKWGVGNTQGGKQRKTGKNTLKNKGKNVGVDCYDSIARSL